MHVVEVACFHSCSYCTYIHTYQSVEALLMVVRLRIGEAMA